MVELLDNTTYVQTTQSGVKGGKFTCKINGKSIFLPYAGFCLEGTNGYYLNGTNGFYWSSTLNTENSSMAKYLYMSNSAGKAINDMRNGGFPVRAVKKAK